MGRKNKAYFKDLHQQAYDRLTGMQAFGESKKEAVANGTEKDKIFAFNTYKSYWKHTKYFIKYIKEKHPECTTLKSAKKYANECFRPEWIRGFQRGRCSLKRKRWESYTGFPRMTRITLIRPSENVRRLNGAGGTGCGTSISPRRTMMN